MKPEHTGISTGTSVACMMLYQILAHPILNLGIRAMFMLLFTGGVLLAGVSLGRLK